MGSQLEEVSLAGGFLCSFLGANGPQRALITVPDGDVSVEGWNRII